VERPPSFASSQRSIGLRCLFQSSLGFEGDDGVEKRIDVFGALYMRLHNFHTRQLFGEQAPPQVGGTQEIKVGLGRFVQVSPRLDESLEFPALQRVRFS
jgi:hypothetical protein